jgi:hypothetical protein
MAAAVTEEKTDAWLEKILMKKSWVKLNVNECNGKNIFKRKKIECSILHQITADLQRSRA